jgi:hypothetical protein
VTRPETVSARELERMMKLQDVILKAMAKRITWMAAAEIAVVSDRTMHRKCERLEGFAPQPLHKGNAEVSDECSHPLFVWRVDKAEICSLKQAGYAKVVSFEFSVTRVRLVPCT